MMLRPAALVILATLLAAPAAASAQAAPVWKCRVGDQVRYSDQPCASQGEQVPARALQGNVVDTAADAARRRPPGGGPAIAPGVAPAAAPDVAGPPANVCPSDRDITGMETSASSIRLDADAKGFIQDEIRRARQCRKGQGRYSAADWTVSQQAVAAQSSLSGAPDARRRAEAMHSAADPAEGDRIARQRESDRREAQRLERRERLDRRPSRPAHPDGGPAR